MEKVFIIEDEALLRDLVIDLLKTQKDMEIVGASGDGLEGWKQCQKANPDMVILDVRLPSLNGIEVSQRLRSERPDIKILVFSGMFSIGVIKRVMMTKANGIIEKAAGLQEMEKAIRMVASGQSYYGPGIVDKMPELLLSKEKDQTIDALTPREREILQLIAEGYTTKEIADKLSISSRTADVHRTHIMQKLDAHNVAGLTRIAVSFGLISVPVAI